MDGQTGVHCSQLERQCQREKRSPWGRSAFRLSYSRAHTKNLPPWRLSRTGVGRFVKGNPGYWTKAISTMTNAPMKCATCNGPDGMPKKGLAPSANIALTVPYSSSSKKDSSASAKGWRSKSYKTASSSCRAAPQQQNNVSSTLDKEGKQIS